MEGNHHYTEDDLKKYLDEYQDDALAKILAVINSQKVCLNPRKEEQLRHTWKDELSEDIELLKYHEPETGLYYETEDVKAYIQDCKMRHRALSDQEILDYELVHPDKPHKLFFWVGDIYEPYIDEFSALLGSWLTEKLKNDPKISIDKFDNKYIVVCSGAIVKSYVDKINLLEKFRKTLPDPLSGVLAEYLLQERDTYEKIPSIANSLYQNDGTAMLLANNYQLTSAIYEELIPRMPCSIDGRPVLIQINIMGDVNINHTTAIPDSIYEKFVQHIKQDKPDWYRSGKWLPKSILVEKFNELYDQNIALSVLMRNLKLNDLFKEISADEKRSKVAGKLVRMFLTK